MLRRAVTLAAIVVLGLGAAAHAQTRPFDPEIGLGGKDVVWVPTPPELVERMLDLAAVTPSDLVMDLGSGDGRNVIAAARRGARAIGVEYNPDLVRLSTERAEEAGVGGRATFVEGDMFKADISRATVLALFLLPANLETLRDQFLAMTPGTRIVLNTFDIPDWTPDATVKLDGCQHWCTALLYVVPAKVAGRWAVDGGTLELTQTFQMVTGTLTTADGPRKVSGRLRGTALTVTPAGGGAPLIGTVRGDRIDGPSLTARRNP
ncbi:MAG: methyltransferase domain-containing protein [Vicinamibacterales bacterium]